MFNLTLKLKRTVAREWLILVVLIILSPVPVNFVRWTREGTGLLLLDSPDWFERVNRAPNAPQDEDWKDALRVEDYIEHPERLKLVPSTDGKSYRDIPSRSFPDYLAHKMKRPSTYLDLIYIYPIYLLICSIIWAVKLLKRQEAV